MYRLLTFLMLVPCEIFSQGTFFINEDSPLKPEISVDFDEGQDSTFKDKVSSGEIKKQFAIYLVREGKRSRIPVSSKYSVAARLVTLRPIGKLGEGLEFQLFYIDGTDTITQQYFTPKKESSNLEESIITEIFPLSDSIPRNILYFHMRFNNSMQPDKLAFERVGIYDDNGNKFERLWRERSYWLDDNKLLVIMVHPGRVKRGIDLEIPYEDGKDYEFRVSGEFMDVYGHPVKQSLTKKFHVIEEDYEIPIIDYDNFEVPEVGTENGLRITFKDPMDHASIVEGVWIKDSEGTQVDGRFLYQSDSDFSFIPDSKWKAGRYELIFDKIVSDLAANRLNRPFEMDDPSEVYEDKPVVWQFVIK